MIGFFVTIIVIFMIFALASSLMNIIRFIVAKIFGKVSNSHNDDYTSQSQDTQHHKQKKFGDNEGEYVDYEEIEDKK